MRPHVIIRYIGMVMLFNAAFIFVSFLISLYDRDAGQLPLLFSFLITLLLGVFPLVFVPKATDLSNKEGYLVVVLSWILSCFIGSLPLLLYGGEFTFVKALFESVSGYTTTGASILNNVEALPKGILFWRSSMQWVGGIGIVVFVLIILPSLGKAQMTLSKMEISPLAQENFRYRTRKMLNVILVVYLGLTVTQVILLRVYGMGLFEAVNHAFTSVSTGGFSTKNNSISFYNSLGIEMVIIIFMFLSGIHFNILYSSLTLKKNNIFNSNIVRYYFFSTILGILVIAIDLHGKIYQSWWESLRFSAFQVVSLATTTGFATTDTAIWPPFTIIVLLFFSLQCACAGSTGGGIKVDRVVIFYKAFKSQILRLQHPQAVIPIRIGKSLVSDDVVNSVTLFIVFYLLLALLGTLALTALGFDMLTSFTAAIASISNVGPGFGLVGSMSNYSVMPDLALIILSFLMLLGRLEFFGLLLLFMVKSWR
ncbi:MAG TPA: TrkH family potassium uptake protein [Bacteroidales bacterium]|nr:TrkH family potassium uptake protein [Bacteroidales bacterium]